MLVGVLVNVLVGISVGVSVSVAVADAVTVAVDSVISVGKTIVAVRLCVTVGLRSVAMFGCAVSIGDSAVGVGG